MDFARWFILSTFVALVLGLSACSTAPKPSIDQDDADFGFDHSTTTRSHSPVPVFKGVTALQSDLGMNRQPSDLGFTEQAFKPCSYGLSPSCDNQYLTVVHFQLLCRDTEGTVSEVPVALTPIVHPQILWSLAGQSGGTPTDRNGYGHFTVISERPLRGHRLILRKGAQYVGVTVSEVNKLVLPKNWCGRG